MIIEELKGVVKLQLNSNRFGPEGLKRIWKLERLKVLDIRNNSLGD